jgi:hypothetical protein
MAHVVMCVPADACSVGRFAGEEICRLVDLDSANEHLYDGTGTMSLAQAHLHRHAAMYTKTIAGHDGTGVIRQAQWHNNNGIGTMERAWRMS